MKDDEEAWTMDDEGWIRLDNAGEGWRMMTRLTKKAGKNDAKKEDNNGD